MSLRPALINLRCGSFAFDNSPDHLQPAIKKGIEISDEQSEPEIDEREDDPSSEELEKISLSLNSNPIGDSTYALREHHLGAIHRQRPQQNMSRNSKNRPECSPPTRLLHVLHPLGSKPLLCLVVLLRGPAVLRLDALDLVEDGPIEVGGLREGYDEGDGQRDEEGGHAAEQARLCSASRCDGDLAEVMIRGSEPDGDTGDHPNNRRDNRSGLGLSLPKEGEAGWEHARVNHVSESIQQPSHVDATLVEGCSEGRDEEGGCHDADVGPADELFVGGVFVDVCAVDVEGDDGGGGDHLG